MGSPVPTLDTNGWLKDAHSKTVSIFLDYLSTSHSQSDLHRDTIRSLPFTIASNPRDMVQLRNAVIDDLTAIYGAYSDSVSANVTITDVDNTKELPYFNIIMDVKVQEGIETFSIGRFINVENGQIQNISEN